MRAAAKIGVYDTWSNLFDEPQRPGVIETPGFFRWFRPIEDALQNEFGLVARIRLIPVTSAWMESLVKEMNYRVKGTEMFWNDPNGTEAILQVRSAALCDDDRLSRHLRNRPGSPLTRRPKPPKSPAERRKS
jgi:hypothetical protein